MSNVKPYGVLFAIMFDNLTISYSRSMLLCAEINLKTIHISSYGLVSQLSCPLMYQKKEPPNYIAYGLPALATSDNTEI